MTPADLIRSLRRIQIRTRRNLPGGVAASYRTVFRGQGVEFAEVRDYVPGDDVRLIDWNVTARLRRLHVKQLIEERELTVVVAVQCSRSMDYGTGRRTKFQAAAETAATLLFSALQAGDRAGLILYGGGPPTEYLPPRKGAGWVFPMLQQLLARPLGDPVGDARGILQLLAHGAVKRGVVFLLGDFIYDEWDARLLEAAARRHDLTCLAILDETECFGPPPGLYDLVGDGRRGLVSVGSPALTRYAREVAARLETFRLSCQHARADFHRLDPAGSVERTLQVILSGRGRRVRA